MAPERLDGLAQLLVSPMPRWWMGLFVITVVFADHVDLYFARQLVLERLIAAKEKLPKGVEPVLGPIATGLSEIYQYTLEEENAPPPSSTTRASFEMPTTRSDGR